MLRGEEQSLSMTYKWIDGNLSYIGESSITTGRRPSKVAANRCTFRYLAAQ